MLMHVTDGDTPAAGSDGSRNPLRTRLRVWTKGQKAWLSKRKGSNLYNTAEPPADWLKGIAQMAIGVATVATIAVLVWIPSFRGIGVAELALRVLAIGLALAAVVELTYSLFTTGPDEALNPLILGLSSFVLVKISAPKAALTMSNAGAIALLVLALGALFALREIFIERPKAARKDL